jgi:chemotaxis protein MotB
MIESKLTESSQNRSTLQEVWPPKWFFSYSDLSVLLMTFFIILATMLALKIPLYVFAEEKLKPLVKERIVVFEEIRRLTELERMMVDEFETMKPEQIERIVALEKINELKKKINRYIKQMKLDDYVKVDVGKFSLRIVPLSPFLFKRASGMIKPGGKELLDQIAEFTKLYPSYIKIEGHTDNTPIHTRQFSSNWELSVARANSVMKYLTEKHNIPYDTIKAVGYGEYQPLVPNDTAERRATNRRVIIEVLIKE